MHTAVGCPDIPADQGHRGEKREVHLHGQDTRIHQQGSGITVPCDHHGRGRGHRIEGLEQVPIIVEDELESVRKTSETREIFKALGVYDDVVKAKESKKIRAGRGKTRGRKYKSGKGPLVVVGEDKGISLGARNHAGVEIVAVENLNAELLAPGTHAGRLTIFTKSAIEKIGGLFQ